MNLTMIEKARKNRLDAINQLDVGQKGRGSRAIAGVERSDRAPAFAGRATFWATIDPTSRKVPLQKQP